MSENISLERTAGGRWTVALTIPVYSGHSRAPLSHHPWRTFPSEEEALAVAQILEREWEMSMAAADEMDDWESGARPDMYLNLWISSCLSQLDAFQTDWPAVGTSHAVYGSQQGSQMRDA